MASIDVEIKSVNSFVIRSRCGISVREKKNNRTASILLDFNRFARIKLSPETGADREREKMKCKSLFICNGTHWHGVIANVNSSYLPSLFRVINRLGIASARTPPASHFTVNPCTMLASGSSLQIYVNYRIEFTIECNQLNALINEHFVVCICRALTSSTVGHSSHFSHATCETNTMNCEHIIIITFGQYACECNNAQTVRQRSCESNSLALMRRCCCVQRDCTINIERGQRSSSSSSQ